MEALAALGIACNLMQVISFTGETITLCKHTYKRGSADPTLEGNAKTLHVLMQSLDESLHESTAQVTPDLATIELQVLARKCLDAVTSLSTQLNRIGTSGSQGSVSRTIVAVSKHLWKSGDLRRLQNEIDGYQKILESGLLVKICTANEAAKIQSREEFKSLNTTLQHFINGLSKSQVHASQMIQSIDKRIENGFLAIRDEATQKRVLRSLKYDGMNDRRNTIKKHHRKTFEWIFRGQAPLHDPEDDYSSDFESDSASENSVAYSDISESESTSFNGHNGMVDEAASSDTSEDDATLPWDDFVAWLQSDDPVYWVSGKPGSGKSTLMLFLLQDTRTQALLDKWRPRTRIISHFLLSSGHLLQRSVKGIYISLLHQILEEDIQENGFLLSMLAQRIPRVLSKDNVGDWADVELKRALRVILMCSTKPTCIFIDGLDELVPSEIDDDLWSFLQNLQSISQLKICLSSRPEPTFQIQLEKAPKLRIHTLTEGDIRTYATDFLKSTILPTRNNTTASERQRFVRTICERSNGVFLWVHLVLKRLRRGLTNNDSITVLNDRLKQTPKELHDLFNDMWSRLGQDAELTDYISTAATYFGLVATAQSRCEWPLGNGESGITVPDVMLATDRRFLQKVVDGSDIDPEEIKERCETVLMNLETRCAGFLECHKVDLLFIPRQHCRYTSQISYHKLHIQFIHRSALEYLLSTREGNRILAHDVSTTGDRLALLCQVDLAIARLWGFRSQSDQANGISSSCLTMDNFLGILSGYAYGNDGQLISKSHWLSLLSLGGLIYTDVRCRNEDFFSFYAGSKTSDFIDNKSPDFIMIVCSLGCATDLLPAYLELLGSRVTPDYLGYLSMLICRCLASISSENEYVRNEGLSVGKLCIAAESAVQNLIGYGANVNVEGPQSLGPYDIEYNEFSTTYYDLETPVSVLIRELYCGPSDICLQSILRIISMFLKNGADMNRTMIYSGTMYLYHGSQFASSFLVSGIISPGRPASKGPQLSLVFTTTPAYLLRLALSSFPQIKYSTAWSNIPQSVVTDLIDLEVMSSNLDTPEPLSLISTAHIAEGGPAEFAEPLSIRFSGHQNGNSDTHKESVQLLLIDYLELLGLPYPSREEAQVKFLDRLANIALQCETTALNDLKSELAPKYNLKRSSEYLAQIPQLGEENERILRDHLRKEAYNHRGE